MFNDPSTEKPAIARRERRFAARWQQILKAAARLFADKGFHRTTTREIAEAASVSEGTLYNYFKNKDDILYGILTQLVEAQSQTNQPTISVSMDASQFFTDYLNQRKKHFDKNSIMMQALISEILSNSELREQYYSQLVEPSIHMMESLLRVRMAIGQIREIDAAQLSRVFYGLLMGLFLLKAIGDPVIDSHWDELSELTTSIVFDGLTPT
jgi:AcrR family transcriptional regulator